MAVRLAPIPPSLFIIRQSRLLSTTRISPPFAPNPSRTTTRTMSTTAELLTPPLSPGHKDKKALVAEDVAAHVGGQHNVDKLKAIARDFRTDTITIPTDGMLLASVQATRGDSVYFEDEDTTALERRIAQLTGKEDCLFAVSGTMTNQLGIRAHLTSPPHSVITDVRAHVHKNEGGGIALFSQATTHTISPLPGHTHITAEQVEDTLELGDDVHIAPTKLVCLENTLSGTVFNQDEIIKISEIVKEHDIPLHLDGARLWNVAAKVIAERNLDPTDEEVRRQVLTELCEPFDSVSLCLSKGIGAPIGSALVGKKEYIKLARRFKKAFGGGIRQAGVLTSQADYALTHHFPKLAYTHDLAKVLAEGLSKAGCAILAPVDTNMVFYDPTPIGLSANQVTAHLASLSNPIRLLGERLVVHHQIQPQTIQDFIHEVQLLAQGVKEGTYKPLVDAAKSSRGAYTHKLK